MNSSSEKVPISRAFLWILLCTIVVSGSSWMGWLYYIHIKTASEQNDQYQIIALTQSSQQKEGLKTVYLEELLDLSIDNPTNIYQFDTKQGLEKLLASPLIKLASIKKIRPGTLYIDYAIRTPIGYLGDYSNTAFDDNGILFPFNPFFTPKRLPIIFLGLESLDKKWGDSISDHPGFQLALDVIETIRSSWGSKFNLLKQIDVSQSFAESFGQRQIVLLVEEYFESDSKKNNSPYNVKSYYLRLNTKDYEKNLANYIVLRQHLQKEIDLKQASVKDGDGLKPKPGIIDLRISQLAFFKEEDGL